MQDLFSRARAMHQQAMGTALGGNAGVQAPGAPSAPGAPGHGPAPVPAQGAQAGNFQHMVKQFGLGSVNFDKNPVVARTQLVGHLQQKFGHQYINHPGVRELLDSFNQHSVQKPNSREVNALDSQAGRTVKALLGR